MFTRKVKVIEVDKSEDGKVIHYRDQTDNHYYLNTDTGRITDGDPEKIYNDVMNRIQIK